MTNRPHRAIHHRPNQCRQSLSLQLVPSTLLEEHQYHQALSAVASQEVVQSLTTQQVRVAVDQVGGVVQSVQVQRIFVNSFQRVDRVPRDRVWFCAKTKYSARLNQFRVRSMRASPERRFVCCQHLTLWWYQDQVLRQDER